MILIPQVQVYPITISLVVRSPHLVRLLALLVEVLHGICYGMNNDFELCDFLLFDTAFKSLFTIVTAITKSKMA